MLLLSTTFNFIRAKTAELRAREDGVTAVEYALMVAIIAVLLVGGFYALFNAVEGRYEEVGNCVSSGPLPETCSPSTGP